MVEHSSLIDEGKKCEVNNDSTESDRSQICVIDSSASIHFSQFEMNTDIHPVNHIMVNTDHRDVYSCTPDLNDLNKSSKGIYLLANFAGKNAAMLVDTGASINVMAKSVFDGLKNKPILEQSNLKVCSVSGDRIQSFGQAVIPMTIKEQTHFPKFEIVDIPDKIILGVSTMSTLNGIIDLKARNVHLAGIKIPCLVLDGQPKLQRESVTRITTVNPVEGIIVPVDYSGCTISRKVSRHTPRSCSNVALLGRPTRSFSKKSSLLTRPAVTVNRSKMRKKDLVSLQ